MIRFTKYDERGAYHWREYVRGRKYREHADYIAKWVREKKILDVGAGDGLITYLIRAQGVEYEETAVAIAKAMGVDVVHGDAYHLDFPDSSFDAVTMFDVLEHFEHPEIALKEAARVAPILYITTPERGMVHDIFHVQEWKRDELPIFMAEHGWILEGEIVVKRETKSMYAKFIKQ
jgi:2-polyprenyl-3-methyl-5-hydroxy-6-metoxy-1,4-benzoquinol methylase